MFLLVLKAIPSGQITSEFLDATKVASHMAGDEVSLSNASVSHLLMHFFLFGFGGKML